MTQYINGEELIKCFTNEYGLTYLVENTDVVRIIKEMPAEDVQPIIHGKWKVNNYGEHYCSNCHFFALYDDEGIEVLINYCPFCGAKMEESEEKE